MEKKSMPNLLVSKIAVLPLSIVEWVIVGWYVLYWDLFPKYSLRRLIPWFLLLASVVAIPVAQALLYRRLTSTNKVEGWFVPITIFIESAISVGLVLYFLKKRRSQVGAERKGTLK
jgi:hypothetical protein